MQFDRHSGRGTSRRREPPSPGGFLTGAIVVALARGWVTVEQAFGARGAGRDASTAVARPSRPAPEAVMGSGGAASGAGEHDDEVGDEARGEPDQQSPVHDLPRVPELL